jgi:hypothetical protein
VLNFGPRQGSLLLGTDADVADLGKIRQASIPARDITACLEEVAKEGCLVLLFLDGIHEELPVKSRRDLHDWVRDLYKRGVIVLLASKQEKSVRLDQFQLGAFAQAILESITVVGRAGAAAGPATSPTLDNFQEAVIRRVEELTPSPHQIAGFYPPESLSRDEIARLEIFKPQARLVEDLVVTAPPVRRPAGAPP